MNTRTLALARTALAAIATLTACGGSGSNGNAEGPNSPSITVAQQEIINALLKANPAPTETNKATPSRIQQCAIAALMSPEWVADYWATTGAREEAVERLEYLRLSLYGAGNAFDSIETSTDRNTVALEYLRQACIEPGVAEAAIRAAQKASGQLVNWPY